MTKIGFYILRSLQFIPYVLNGYPGYLKTPCGWVEYRVWNIYFFINVNTPKKCAAVKPTDKLHKFDLPLPNLTLPNLI